MTGATNASKKENISFDILVATVADEFRERQRRGEKPDVEEYAARHPEAAELLREVLATFQFLETSLPSGEGSAVSVASDAPLTGTLGDFRLIREVGRGGMGIVYEAEQISLGRRVALKVLPFAATFDPRQLQRFHNEARAAASLRHEHIVPVYAVGQERGVHYYAMQFIDGETLAEQIKRQRGAGASEVATATAPEPAAPTAETVPLAGKSTDPAPRDDAYFRRVAEWGIQAAEALEHAHGLGIVHRDIKPGNLMIDAHGQLWITDFGLARRAADSDLTMTGDVLGTLRYMSPEQALAKHDLVDHRSDVYSLGATLYELLTLHCAVDGADREAILHQITQIDPKGLRSWERQMPADLETIVLKALAKEPEGRYATAKELADDLRRYLNHEPILARRTALVHRVRKWSRRHKPMVAALAAALLAAIVFGSAWAGWHYSLQAARQTQTELAVTTALTQVETLLREGEQQLEHPRRFRETILLARARLERAEESLRTGIGTPELAALVGRAHEAVLNATKDSDLLLEFEHIQMERLP